MLSCSYDSNPSRQFFTCWFLHIFRTHGFETGRYICYDTGFLFLSSIQNIVLTSILASFSWLFSVDGWGHSNKKSSSDIQTITKIFLCKGFIIYYLLRQLQSFQNKIRLYQYLCITSFQTGWDFIYRISLKTSYDACTDFNFI